MTDDIAADGCRLNFGECWICKEPFSSGQNNLRLSVIHFYMSQGYEASFERPVETVHPDCATAEWLAEFIKTAKTIQTIGQIRVDNLN